MRLPVGRQTVHFALSDVILAIPFLLAPGAWVPLGMLVSFTLANARKSEGLKLAFNGAQFACSLAPGLLVAQTVHGLPGAACGLLTYAAINLLLVAIPISLTTGRSYLAALAQGGHQTVLHLAGTLSLGLLAAWLTGNAPLGLLGLAAPLGLLWWSYQQQTERAAEARLFEELAQGQERASGRSLDSSAGVVIIAAARLFGGAEVEMILRHPDGPVRYVGDENGVTARERAGADAFSSAWVLRTMGARGVLTGVEDSQPFCSAVLGDLERPLAVFIARRPAQSRGYERSDGRLTQVLINQAEAWLSVAEMTARHGIAAGQIEAYGDSARALGDLGAHTSPALVVLRESANRLSHLAHAFDGPDQVRDIVDELHAVERAVASLLGAVALASDNDLVTGTDPSQRSGALRVDSEWTTTGRLDASELR